MNRFTLLMPSDSWMRIQKCAGESRSISLHPKKRNLPCVAAVEQVMDGDRPHKVGHYVVVNVELADQDVENLMLGALMAKMPTVEYLEMRLHSAATHTELNSEDHQRLCDDLRKYPNPERAPYDPENPERFWYQGHVELPPPLVEAANKSGLSADFFAEFILNAMDWDDPDFVERTSDIAKGEFERLTTMSEVEPSSAVGGASK